MLIIRQLNDICGTRSLNCKTSRTGLFLTTHWKVNHSEDLVTNRIAKFSIINTPMILILIMLMTLHGARQSFNRSNIIQHLKSVEVYTQEEVEDTLKTKGLSFVAAAHQWTQWMN